MGPENTRGGAHTSPAHELASTLGGQGKGKGEGQEEQRKAGADGLGLIRISGSGGGTPGPARGHGAWRSGRSSASTSARSCSRPVARLFRIRSSRARTGTWRPPSSTVARRSQALWKSSPLRLVRMSMRRGETPNWMTISGFWRSAGRRSCRGAPNWMNACQTRSALSGVGRIQRSRSPVALGRPWTARAWAPTRRWSAPAPDNADNISTKSVGIGNGDSTECPGRDGEGPDEGKPLFGRERPLVRGICVVHVGPADLHLRAVSHGFSKRDREGGDSGLRSVSTP